MPNAEQIVRVCAYHDEEQQIPAVYVVLCDDGSFEGKHYEHDHVSGLLDGMAVRWNPDHCEVTLGPYRNEHDAIMALVSYDRLRWFEFGQRMN